MPVGKEPFEYRIMIKIAMTHKNAGFTRQNGSATRIVFGELLGSPKSSMDVNVLGDCPYQCGGMTLASYLWPWKAV